MPRLTLMTMAFADFVQSRDFGPALVGSIESWMAHSRRGKRHAEPAVLGARKHATLVNCLGTTKARLRAGRGRGEAPDWRNARRWRGSRVPRLAGQYRPQCIAHPRQSP